MKRFLSIALYISIILISLFGCSSNSSQPTEASPQGDEPGEAPDEYDFFPTALPSDSTTAKIPVTWANLNLSGKLVYSIGGVDKDNNYVIRIQTLDLATGEIHVNYTAPLNGWIYYIAVSPDARQIVMSYSPPPGGNSTITQALYTMPLDGSQPPQLSCMPPTAHDQYIQAEWSPDGKYIYYTHVNNQIPEDHNRVSALHTIYRTAYPDGAQERIAEGAYGPRLSLDSSHLVYVAADPFSEKNGLMIADADGSNSHEVTLSGSYIPEVIDSPFFSPDGRTIIFSGSLAGESYRPNWFEKFTGIRAAKASGERISDWWSVSVNGGTITRLTHLQASGLYGSLSPDQKHIASHSRERIFVMNLDGSDLTVLFSELNGFAGTVGWIP